jgi:hypothetical protein
MDCWLVRQMARGGMIEGVETRPDGDTLVMRIPMRFHRRGGRRRIVAPDGSDIVPTSKPQPDSTLVKALARAWRWQQLLDERVYATVSEIGDAENISEELRESYPAACAAGAGHCRGDPGGAGEGRAAGAPEVVPNRVGEAVGDVRLRRSRRSYAGSK